MAVTPRIRCARCLPVIRRSCQVICLRVAFCHVIICILSCHHMHCIAYVFVSCIRAFFPLSVLQSGAPMSSGGPFYLFSCVGVINFRIGPRLAMRPWFTTDRPPVKFHAIWSPFDTPTVNRVARNPSFLFAAQHLSKVAQNPSKSLPCSRSFDHDRVAENRTSFGPS